MRLVLCALALASALPAQDAARYDYRVLATTKTGTMEKEMNQAAEAGYVFAGVMGGETGFGGKEVLVVMQKAEGAPEGGRKRYKLLATSRTSTMQKEMQQAGDEGFAYCGVTVFESTFGGREVSVILERDAAEGAPRIEYLLLATTRTSTMEKELRQAGEKGFRFRGVVVGKTAFGGSEVVSILERRAK